MSIVKEKCVLNNFCFNFKSIVIDEIALDGLEGVGLDLLWKRIEKRIGTEVTEKLKYRLWDFIVNCSKVSFYELPEPLPHVVILDRFAIIHEDTGHLQETEEYPDGPYEYCPVNNEYGSCKYYSSRKCIPHTKLKDMQYEAVVSKYGDTMVIVANMEERWQALAGHLPIRHLSLLSPLQYCILELVGRARENGQMTIGKTNLTKIVKDSKTLFYNRKTLRDLDFLRITQITQVINGKGGKSLLLRLKRFYKPSVLTMPKVGVLHDIVDYLLHKPDYSEQTDVLIKVGKLTGKLNKRLQKTVNIFSFAEKTIQIEDAKGKKSKAVKKKIISLSCKSDESSQSDDEPDEEPLKCQYEVGVNLLRQAYDRFLDAGLKGLTQVQLAQLLGIEFYTSRAICRVFRSKKIVREYLEDKGKQRTARYIAVIATENIDIKYAVEKKKLLEFLENDHSTADVEQEIDPKPSTSTSDDEIPCKKAKMEPDIDNKTQTADVEMNSESIVTEVKVLDGCEGVKPLASSKKNPTLRQLTFANGILKVLNDKLCITGYQTLSNLASKEVNEPPMDTKSLKIFIQKLVMEGYLKIFKMKWPGVQKYSVLICARHVKCTDPVIKAKYKEICIRAATKKHVKIKKEITESQTKSMAQFSYPRYLKIQKLHEHVLRVAYFEYVKPESHILPQGFVSIVDLIPEVTVEFVINNISNMGTTEISQLKITSSQMQLKLKEAPEHLYKVLMRSSRFHNAIRTNLKVLGMLGLIQLIGQQSEPTTTPIRQSSFIFYVNKQTKILDTSGTWPRSVDLTSIEKSYHFNTPDDVLKFWNDVFDISTSTTIDCGQRSKKKLMPPLRKEDEVVAHDNGEVFGDGKGPCGFDSCFFMDIPRLWRTFYIRPIKTPHVKTKPHVKPLKFGRVKKIRVKSKANKKRTASPVPQKAPHEKVFRKRTEGNIRWTKQEDMILTMCKAAITIMSPSSQPGSLIIRNAVAKDLISTHDPRKTKTVCHTRALTLESNLTLIHEKQCILNELRRRRDLIVKYENVLKKLRIRYPANMNKFINKGRLLMFELVWIISQVMCSKSYTQRTPCVALNIEEFKKNFTIVASTANKQYNIYTAPEHSTLKETVMLTVMLSFEYELTADEAKEIYRAFSVYPEATLRIAVEQLRKSGAIAAKEKLLHNQAHRLDVEDIVQSSYKLSALYQRGWANRLNSEFIDNLANVLDEEEPQHEFKGSPEINCVFCELQASDVIEIASATIPVIADSKGAKLLEDEVNANSIENKYKLKSGTLTWKNKRNVSLKKFAQIYQDIDLMDILKFPTRSVILNASDVRHKNLDTNDDIISHLKTKAEGGATFNELLELFGYDENTLLEKLSMLESDNIVKMVGFNTNIIVLTDHIEAWSTKFCDKYVIANPWLDFELNIRYDIFLKWVGTVMNRVFEMPGSTIAYLSEKCEFLTCRSVQDVCMFLKRCECVKLVSIKYRKTDIYSDIDAEPEFGEFNPYSVPENILVFPLKECLTKYAYIRRKILEKYVNRGEGI